MARIFFVLVLSTFLLSGISAQELIGTVMDSDGVPIEGVNILNLRSSNHAHSNHNGDFSLSNVEIGDTLLVSHIGYELTTFFIGPESQEIRVQLMEKTISLDEIYISPELNALNVFTDMDIKTSPVNSSQEVLRKVPGMIIGQHAGGGKAEQLFLRGFDLDHGTDISISVDGMPVNMVSHAHGQGYADLHFLIPETIKNINFGKGPYNADQGNFATAGYVGFNTKQQLDNSSIKLEIGQFNWWRVLGMIDILSTDDHQLYVATERIETDGPFESPQNFGRSNLLARYSGKISQSDNLLVSLSWFNSRWDASGQVPHRAISNLSITGLELLMILKEGPQAEEA
jgi:hypothetical protein